MLPSTGRYVLITGCDHGFGHDIAKHLNSMGASVFATCLTQDAADMFNKDDNFKGEAFCLDVTDEQQIKSALERISGIVQDSSLWGIVNNAGVVHPAPLTWQSVESMRKMMDVNLWGGVTVTKTFLPLVMRAKGRIVNITSIAGRISFKNMCGYSMSKFAFESFTDGLREEMRQLGVSVHAIEPGVFLTPMANSSTLKEKWEIAWDSADPEMKDFYGEAYSTAMRDAFCERFPNLCGSSNTLPVVEAVTHALFSQSPCARYVVGRDAKFLWVWLSYLPAWMTDPIIGLHDRFMSVPLPAALLNDSIKTE